MALNTIPVLPEDYPLYDWADWQTSRESLVAGTPTKYFAKEAWNAIVDSLSDALDNAGLAWDSTYTTAEGAKITAAYGKLTAQKFNSVRHNIDWPAPLGWAWAKYSDFRGYVGREDFNGRSTHGKACDKVYPEYIIELVRKLNLLLEIMRNSALLSDIEAEHLTALNIQAEAYSGKAAHVDIQHNSTQQIEAEVRSAMGTPAEAQHTIPSVTAAEVVVPVARSVSTRLIVSVPIRADGNGREALPLEIEGVLAPAKASADVEATQCVEVSVESQVAVSSEAGAELAPALQIDTTAQIGIKHAAEMIMREAILTESEMKVFAATTAEVEQLPALPLTGSKVAATSADVTARRGEAAEVDAAQGSEIAVNCTVTTGWLPPVWLNGGLWIRQVHDDPIQYDNGELEVH